jgi:TonB family protein
MSQRLLHPMRKFAAVSVCFFAFVENVPAQGATGAPTPETGVVLTNLFPPVYPPLARQARITGDVKIQVAIRQDGSVASAEVISGHPMLKQAGLESAQKSTFECQSWSLGVYVVGCRDAVPSFTLIYTFGMRDDLDGLDCSGAKRLRSAKCFYLWGCGNWRSPTPRKPAFGHSSDHVMILADPACLETSTARGPREAH